MLHLFYRWRHERSKRSASFRFARLGSKSFGHGFWNHMAQTALRDHGLTGYERIKRRRTVLRWTCLLGMFAAIAWLINESIQALTFF
jgi:hypothetical protein